MSLAALTEDAKAARWKASEDGARFVCGLCWQGMRTAGTCTECGSRQVLPVRDAPPDPPKAPLPTWLTFPQMEWLDEYRRRAREGLTQLVPKTPTQHQIVASETKRVTPRPVRSGPSSPAKVASRAARSRSR